LACWTVQKRKPLISLSRLNLTPLNKSADSDDFSQRASYHTCPLSFQLQAFSRLIRMIKKDTTDKADVCPMLQGIKPELHKQGFLFPSAFKAH
jgi:hypothetical protein